MYLALRVIMLLLLITTYQTWTMLETSEPEGIELKTLMNSSIGSDVQSLNAIVCEPLSPTQTMHNWRQLDKFLRERHERELEKRWQRQSLGSKFLSVLLGGPREFMFEK